MHSTIIRQRDVEEYLQRPNVFEDYESNMNLPKNFVGRVYSKPTKDSRHELWVCYTEGNKRMFSFFCWTTINAKQTAICDIMDDEEYMELLKAAKERLPKGEGGTRFEIPKAVVQVQGRQTFIRNFQEIFKTLR